MNDGMEVKGDIIMARSATDFGVYLHLDGRTEESSGGTPCAELAAEHKWAELSSRHAENHLGRKIPDVPLTKRRHGCGCLEKVKQKLIEHHGKDSQVELELKMSIDMETFEQIPAIPPLYYSYLDKKKRKKSHVVFIYCPFCGKPAV